MGLAIASVYILSKRKRYGIDEIVSVLSIAISVFKTLNLLFGVAGKKQNRSDQMSKKVDTKRRQKIGYLRVETKTRSVGIVIKKMEFQIKGDPSVHRVRCLPQIAGKRLFSKKRMVDKKFVGMVGCSAGAFEEWPVVGMVMVFRPKSFVCVWTIIWSR